MLIEGLKKNTWKNDKNLSLMKWGRSSLLSWCMSAPVFTNITPSDSGLLFHVRVWICLVAVG